MSTVVLFDIDGTLISAGGAGRRALDRALEAVVGRAGAMQGVELAGRTDPLIVESALLAIGQEPTSALVAEVLQAYVAALPGELKRSDRYLVHAGVRELLLALQRVSTVALGLGTGNVRAGARCKLSHGGLWEHFSFGGFACDHPERAELIRIGAEAGAARLGVARGDCRVVVVGDTERDVQAAHAIGALCVGVTTGPCSHAQLVAAGADLVVEDLCGDEALRFIGA